MLANSRVSAVLPVVDMERAKKFYEEKLDLQATDMATEVMFKCGYGTQLALYQRSTPTKADHTVVGWEVDHIEEMVQALRDRGVVFEQYDLPGLKTNEQGIATVGTVKAAWF